MKFAYGVSILLITFNVTLQSIITKYFNLINLDGEDSKRNLADILKCEDVSMKPSFDMRGDFWVLYNFVPATKKFKCHESLTYTTHADITFINNTETLAKIWNGPISISIYAPGYEFDIAMRSIAYLRNCGSKRIKKYVTWHLFFDKWHFPTNMVNKHAPIVHSYNDDFDCSKPPPYSEFHEEQSYRHRYNLTYPINVARNVARVTATTHYIFPSDIELYPIPNFTQKFFDMILRQPTLLKGKRPQVFVLPVFEILEGYEVPENKTALIKMLKNHTALPFHVKLCRICHSIPHFQWWIDANETDELNVLTEASRKNKYSHWEPFYVGTQDEPLFDERLTWEGQSNKISQAYAMCLLDYDFLILDNAFLVHRPGVKKHKVQLRKYKDMVRKTNRLLKQDIKPELIKMYGPREGCKMK